MSSNRSVPLTTLLDRVAWTDVAGSKRRDITGIAIDSRAVERGSIFVALRGTRTDGHRFIADAVANGASVLVVEDSPSSLPATVTVVRVPDSRRALSSLAAAFYGEPSHALDVIGVTGTNGKTTTTHFIAAILNAAGIPCGIAGTVGAEFGANRRRLENTTPLPHELHAVLAQMRDEGARAVAMEVSSHALALERVEDVRFKIAVLTNVARDHLDFHETLDAYAAAKRRLFSLAPACVMNCDDEYGERWAVEAHRQGRTVVSYGERYAAMLAPEEIVVAQDGSGFTLNGQRYRLNVPGRFNIWNALAAIGVAELLGVDAPTAARGLAAVEHVPGRMERIVNGSVAVVVDYAHTPDALASALRSLRETTRGRLAVVFGCGGDRDRGKRPEMGAVASRLADRLYVTSDNPRTEAPQAIAKEILAGIGARDYIVELDRRRAIERAIAESQPGDVVLVAGKGHETYQIVGDQVLPFDDGVIARKAIAARRALR